MSILFCAQVERCKAMKPGKTLNTDPGSTDLQTAINLANLSSPWTNQRELNAYGVDILFMSSNDFKLHYTDKL